MVAVSRRNTTKKSAIKTELVATTKSVAKVRRIKSSKIGYETTLVVIVKSEARTKCVATTKSIMK